MPVQSVGQSIPPGGVTATQPVQPTGTQTPADISAIVEALTPIQARFRQQSSFLHIALPQASFTTPGLGVDVPIGLSNVGLAVRTITEWNAVITITNGNTGGSQTTSVSQYFPFNLPAQTLVSINGGAAIYSCSGPAAYSVMTRQRKGSRRLGPTQNGWAAVLDPAYNVNAALLQQMTFGTGNVATGATAIQTFLGGASVYTLSGSATPAVTVRFITVERFVQDRDSMLGCPPLQNNSTFVQIVRRLVGSLSGTKGQNVTDFNTPFLNPLATLTFALTSCTADSTYEFASVPGDPTLYASLVSNSFQTQEQRGFTVTSTGSEAWNYALPTNAYYIALHNIATDGAGAAINAYGTTGTVTPTQGFGLLKLVYAGASVIPVRDFPFRERAMAYLDYDYDPMDMVGCRMWDGERSSDDINAADNMLWLDAYATASPTELIDIGTSTTTNVIGNITREVVIVGNVQQVGGGS